MNSISPKVSGSAGAAGVSTPVAIIVIWLIGLTHVVVPPEVAAAIASLLAALSAFAVGYYMPHDPQIVALLAGQQPPPIAPVVPLAAPPPPPVAPAA
jgi:hypothetical protein